MTMESNVRACGALNMASTGRLKKVDEKYDDAADMARKQHLAQLIRENVRPKGPSSPLDALLRLASIDAERMKILGELFALVLSQPVAEIDTPSPPPAPRRRRRRKAKVLPFKAPSNGGGDPKAA